MAAVCVNTASKMKIGKGGVGDRIGDDEALAGGTFNSLQKNHEYCEVRFFVRGDQLWEGSVTRQFT